MVEPEEPASVESSDDPSVVAYICAVWNLIIRPPRAAYGRAELMGDFPCGRFMLHKQPVERSNFLLTNDRGIKLACTLIEPEVAEARERATDGRARPRTANAERACVIFCHGNASCRLAAFRLVNALLPLNIALACFDFSGCGMSGGKYISLGYYERDDLACVIRHLREDRGFNRIAVWGQSMGAVTALMHSARDPSLAGVVADSPFADLWALIEEVCYTFARVPSFVVTPVLNLVRWIIRRKASFDIKAVSPLAAVSNCFIPALFLHGERDDFIGVAHSEKLKRAYPGEAQLLIMPCVGHNCNRDKVFDARATLFLVRALRWEQYLPEGIKEEELTSMIERCQRRGSGQVLEISPAVEKKIANLMASDNHKDHSLGIARMVCELCVAYHGAKVSPCDAWTGKVFPPSMDGTACCKGRVMFEGDQAEIGICWPDLVSGFVMVAMLSPASVSLSEVRLTSVQHIRNTPGCSPPKGRTCADHQWHSATTLAFGTLPGGAQLQRCRHHAVTLVISSTDVRLSVGDVHISCAAKYHGPFYLWHLRWGRQPDAQGSETLLELESGEAPPEETGAPGGGARLGGAPPQGGSPVPCAVKKAQCNMSARLTEGLESLRSRMRETSFVTDESAVPEDIEELDLHVAPGGQVKLRGNHCAA